MLLRDYQLSAVARTLAALRERPLLVMPGGSGKTITAAEIVRQSGMRTTWIAHRIELLQQAAEVGAEVVSVFKRKPRSGELLVIDEAHRAPGSSYAKYIENHEHVLGLTATPFRLDGRGLGDIFKTLIVGATTAELCRDGWLHEPKVYAGASPDVHGLHKRGGDYAIGELELRANHPRLVGNVVGEWLRRARGKRTLCFAVGIEHSRSLCEAFRSAGVAAEHLDGTSRDRAEVLDRLRNGATQVICNCQLFTEGTDLPSLECVIIARPTASLCLHQQIIFRVMRRAEGKDGALILDHAGNHHQHGPITRRIEYALHPDRKVVKPEQSLMRQCKACAFMFLAEIGRCPECGWAAPARKPPRYTKGELAEFHKQRWARMDENQRADVLARLRRTAEERGYKPGWAAVQYKFRFGEWPKRSQSA